MERTQAEIEEMETAQDLLRDDLEREDSERYDADDLADQGGMGWEPR